jgi:ribosome-binding factor A
MEGNSVRQNKVSKLLQNVLADIFQKKGFSAYGGVMITVTEVRISTDLYYAKAYLSIFATKQSKEEVITLINKDAKSIRFELGKIVKNQLRIIPEISFFIDNTIDEIAKIDKLLK